MIKSKRPKSRFNYATVDLGNIVEFGHVNVCISDQRLATIFYVSGLGLTRDPYMRTGVENMWINVGLSQIHLPSRAVQVLRGVTGLVVPDLAALRARLKSVQPLLAGTCFSFAEVEDGMEVVCPWGNRFRCHAPDVERFGAIRLGMPYVEVHAPPGTLEGIALFYSDVLAARSGLGSDSRGAHAWVSVGITNTLLFREVDIAPVPYDGHHIQVTFANLSGPHKKLLELGLISQEDDQHQYRFQDIVDPRNGRVLVTIEHEVRSMRHPLFGRPLVNRNTEQTAIEYGAGQDNGVWSLTQSTPPPPQ